MSGLTATELKQPKWIPGTENQSLAKEQSTTVVQERPSVVTQYSTNIKINKLRNGKVIRAR